MSSSIREEIEAVLEKELQPLYLEVVDDSARHAGHREASESGESHFSVTICSEEFKGLSILKQHQLVYKALKEVLKNKIHALELKTLVPPSL